VAGFLARVERPVLTGLTLDWPGGAPAESYPPRLPDLHAGEPLFVSLRWDGEAPEEITVRGHGLDGPYERTVTAGAAEARDPGRLHPAGAPAGAEGRLEEGGAIPTRWARAKVEELADRRRHGGDADALRAAIVAVGLEHHLVTPFTSLVAVEECVTASGSAIRVPVANALPHGSQLLGALPAGGTLSPLRSSAAILLLATGILLLGARRRDRTRAAT
jgi:Ca-activated chloride channel family protein